MSNISGQYPTLIITGMHRSGTSLTASLLQSAGVNIGRELMSANRANLKGYFENMDFVGFHEKILIERGIAKEGWTLEKKMAVPEHFIGQARDLIENNQALPVWGWKDPRTTLFLDFWAELLPQARFIFIHRSPWEVIDSLYRRGSLGDEIFVDKPEFAIELWASYNRALLDFYNNNKDKCLLYNLNTIAVAPELLIKGIEHKFAFGLDNVENLYDESLINKQISQHRLALINEYFPETFELYEHLNQISDIPYETEPVGEINLNSDRNHFKDKDSLLREWVTSRVVERELKLFGGQNLEQEIESVQDHRGRTENAQEQLAREIQVQVAESEGIGRFRKAWFKIKKFINMK